jgi:DNA-directed RNA polymerase specialized sigma24 family protein
MPSDEVKKPEAAHLLLLADWLHSLKSALKSARAEGCPRNAVNAKEVAWAVAWLVEEAGRDESPMKKSLIHLRDAALNNDLDGLHKILTRRLGKSTYRERTTMPLQELAWSVACERRLDWRPPAPEQSGPKAKAVAARKAARSERSNQTFTKMHEMEGEVVQAACRKLAKKDPAELADRAWSAAYATYWSEESKRRWAGNARVSTLIFGVAKKLSLSDWAQRRHTSMDDEADIQSAPFRTADPASIPEEIGQIASDRQLEILRLLIERGLTQKQVAHHLGVSEATVSQELTRLAKRMEPLGYGKRKGRRGKI